MPVASYLQQADCGERSVSKWLSERHAAYCAVRSVSGAFVRGVCAHFLAEFDLQRGFRVRQSFIARDGGQWFGRAYHLLDDVSAVKHVSV